MVTRTFIEKSNTIFKDCEENFGLNPIGMLNYGKIVSRCLLYFNIDNMKKGGKHYLKLSNCGTIDKRTFDEMVFTANDTEPKERACSFDIIAFRIPEFWDGGKGFDFSTDFWLVGKNAVSTHGSNWFYAYDGKLWGTKIEKASGTIIPEEGAYNNEFLAEEYIKFSEGEESVIISRQHFDAGNEDINMDITSYVEDILAGKYENYGIGLAFTPMAENTHTKYTQYYGFFTDNTNTFFHPIVESRYDDCINDNRYSFYIGKANKLYFYANLGGVLSDLEDLPVCHIKGSEYPVKRLKTGVYYVEVKLDKNEVRDNEIVYDTWSNLIYEGEELEEVEMEFVAHKKESYFLMGEYNNKVSNVIPSLSGINDSERISQGDERTVQVTFKIPYSSDYELINGAFYRLYVKDAKREVTVIDWDDIETIGKSNSFQIKSAELMPNEYHIDIKAKIGNDIRIFKDKLVFVIVDNATELKK